MNADSLVLPGIVKGGVIIPQGTVSLPEGALVEIVLRGGALTPELQAELDAWERAGDEAWRLIKEWEREERP